MLLSRASCNKQGSKQCLFVKPVKAQLLVININTEGEGKGDPVTGPVWSRGWVEV